MQTEQIISRLAKDAKAVRRLPPPIWRALLWFVISLLFAGAVVAFLGVRADILSKLGEVLFIIELSSAFVTSALAATAAFCTVHPGRPQWEKFAPLPSLAVWLGVLVYNTVLLWRAGGIDAIAVSLDLMCLPCIVLIASVPAFLIVTMVRRGAPVMPGITMGLAVLAAAALGAGSLRLFHPQDSGSMILVWQVGPVALLALLGAATSSYFLRWPHERKSA